jgi:nucleoid-associated protein YgaU
LRELTDRHPEDFVPVDAYGQPDPTQIARPRDPTPAPPVAAPRQYTAQPGDSVSRMASRLLGSNTKANRDLIIRANPSLQGQGNVVVAGKSYVIPNVPGAAPAPAAGRTPVRQAASEATARGPSFTWYTVKENDNLTRIAAEQLGNGNAWSTLLEYNKDILKDGNKLKANMRIRVPVAPVASTAN